MSFCDGVVDHVTQLSLHIEGWTGIWFLSQLTSPINKSCVILHIFCYGYSCVLSSIFTCVLCCMYVLWYSFYVQSRHFMHLFSKSGGWNEYYYMSALAETDRWCTKLIIGHTILVDITRITSLVPSHPCKLTAIQLMVGDPWLKSTGVRFTIREFHNCRCP